MKWLAHIGAVAWHWLGSLSWFHVVVTLELAALVAVGLMIWRGLLGNSLMRYRQSLVNSRLASKLEKADQMGRELTTALGHQSRGQEALTGVMRDLLKEVQDFRKDLLPDFLKEKKP